MEFPKIKGHPVSGNEYTLTLYDRFHSTNLIRPSVDLCPDLKSINTSVAEQQNRVMARDRYFSPPCITKLTYKNVNIWFRYFNNNMKPVNFLLATRLAMHMRNHNETFIKSLKCTFKCEIKVNKMGFAVPISQGKNILKAYTEIKVNTGF